MTEAPRDAIGLSERLRADIGERPIYRSDALLREAATQLDALHKELAQTQAHLAIRNGDLAEAVRERDSLQERVKELEAKNEKLNLHLQYFVERVQYNDSYGVPGSDFMACLCCRGGGAPNVPMIHEDHCPVGRSLDAFQEWCDEQREFEEESAANAKRAHESEFRATRAEQERDKLEADCSFYASQNTNLRNDLVLSGMARDAAQQERDEALERAAKIIDAECERILAKQTPTNDPLSTTDTINLNLRMMACVLPDLAAAIRRLAAGPDKEKRE